MACQSGLEPETPALTVQCTTIVLLANKIGTERFELPTFCAQGRRTTRLCYVPSKLFWCFRLSKIHEDVIVRVSPRMIDGNLLGHPTDGAVWNTLEEVWDEVFQVNQQQARNEIHP